MCTDLTRFGSLFKAICVSFRMTLVWSAKERYKKDGYAQLHTLNYTIKFVSKHFLYTHIMVDIGLPSTTS